MNVLFDYCISITDGTHSTVSDDPNGDCYLLSAKNVKGGVVSYDSSDRRISKKDLDKLRKRTHTELDDVLLTTVGSIGETALVKSLDYELQRSVAIIKTDRKMLLPQYLLYSLNSSSYQKIIDNYVCGSVQKCLFLDQIKNIPFDAPDISIQQKIVNILFSLDNQIGVLNQIDDNLLASAKAMFRNALNNEIIISTSILDVCSSITDGVHNTVKDDPEGPALLLSCKNIKDGQLIIGNSERTISLQTFDKLRKRTNLAAGDILLTSVGTIGETYLLLDNPKNIEFQRSVALIKPNPDKVSSEYLYLAIDYVKDNIINAAHGAVQQCLFINDVCSIEVPIIDGESIEKLTKAVRPLFKLINLNRKQSLQLAILRDYLLPKLMSGEIDVSALELPTKYSFISGDCE